MPDPLYDLLYAVERALTRCAAGPAHPAVVRVFAVRREDGQLVVQCEKPDGIPLAALLRQQRVLSMGEAMECLRPLAAALEHAAANQLPRLDLVATSVIVQPADPAAGARPFRPKTPPLALTVLNQLKDLRQGKTMLVDPLRLSPAVLEIEPIKHGIASLAALAFELLSGRPVPARAADYRPISPLSEAGNHCLRRALGQSSSFALPGNFLDELASGARYVSSAENPPESEDRTELR